MASIKDYINAKINRLRSNVQASPNQFDDKVFNFGENVVNTGSTALRALGGELKAQQDIKFQPLKDIRSSAREFVSKPIPEQYQQPLTSFFNKAFQNPVSQFGSGLVGGGMFNLAGSPGQEPTTKAGSIARTAGNLVGAFNPQNLPMKTLGAVGKIGEGIAKARFTPGTSRITQIAAPAIAREVLQTLTMGGAAAVAGKPINLATDLVYGLGLSAGFGSVGNIARFGKLYNTDVKEVKEVWQMLEKAKKSGKIDLEAMEAGNKLADILGKAYKMYDKTDKQAWKMMPVEEKLKMIARKQIDLHADQGGMIAGLVDNKPKAVDGTNEGIKQVNSFLETKYGRSLDKATKTQITEALAETKSFLPHNEQVYKRFTNPKSGWSFEKDPLVNRTSLYFGGDKQNVYTDAFVAILDKTKSAELRSSNIESFRKAEIKRQIKSGLNHAEATKYVDLEIKKAIKTAETSYPDVEQIIPKIKGTPAFIQGYTSGGYEGSFATLSDGQRQIKVNPDKLALLKKIFPNATPHITEIDKPITFVQNGKIKALLMPVRSEEAFQVPASYKPSGISVPKPITEPSKPKAVGEVGETPKTVKVWIKSKFSNDGGYADIPVIRKEKNITLYQGGSAEGRQFWTPDEKYAKQFGEVTEKTGDFYKIDNGNRVTDVYVEAKPKAVGGVGDLDPSKYKSAEEFGKAIGVSSDSSFKDYYRKLAGDTGYLEQARTMPLLSDSEVGKNLPNEITVYRGIPDKRPVVKSDSVGDFFSLSKKDASSYGENIIEITAPKTDFRINELAPSGTPTEIIYFPKEAQKIKDKLIKDKEVPSLIEFYNKAVGGVRDKDLGIVDKNRETIDKLQTEILDILKKNVGESGNVEKLSSVNRNKINSMQKQISTLSEANKKIFQPKAVVGVTKATDTLQPGKLTGIQPQTAKISGGPSTYAKPKVGLQTDQITRKSIKQSEQALDDIIQQGRKEIGRAAEKPDKNVKQTMDDLYTQWVDRYNPITKASEQAKKTLKAKGATLRPEYDPSVLVRRLTGAGGIADHRFTTELNPIIKEIETLGVPKLDMDVYLANKRLAGFGDIGREVYGADSAKAKGIVQALETKYPGISDTAGKLYKYQDKGFQEMIDAGFISPENAKIIKQQNPDYSPLYRVMDDVDNYLGLPTRKTMQGSQPIAKLKGSKRQIESPVEGIIGNTFRQRAAIEKNRVAQAIVGLEDIAGDMGFKKVSKAGDGTITIWKNGKKEFWEVGADIAETAKGVNEENMNVVLKILKAPAALLRQGATGRNPEFFIPNVVRDQLDAGITSKYGYIPFVDFVSGFTSILKNDDVYKQWAESGAKIDLGSLSGKKSIQQLFDEKKASKGLFSWLGEGLDVLGKYSEQPTRVGLFKKGIKKTGNPLLAMMESRDATVDFARMGTKMKTANSIIPFLNVGIQGFDKLIRAVKNNPVKVATLAAIYGAAPAAMTTMWNLVKHPEEYGDIPQYEKDNNFVLVIGRNKDGTVDYRTIPKGNVLPVISNPVTDFLEYAYGADKQSFNEMVLSTMTGALPVIGQGSTLGEVGLRTVGQNLPQAVKPIAENLLNKSFFKYDPKKEQAKEIVPYYLQNKPDYQQDYEFTPQMYKKIGAVLDASPLKVKNLMEGYMAGFTKIPANIIDSLYNISRGKEVEPNQKPLLRRFVKRTYPTSNRPPKPKQPTPKLFERLTGKVGAAEEATEKAVFSYYDDNSNYKTIDVGKITSLPETNNYEKALKEKETFSIVDDILENLPEDQQVDALGKLNIKPEDATYYNVARQQNKIKLAYVQDVIGNKKGAELMKELASMRRVVGDKFILAPGVIDDLVDEGIISYGEGKYLKSIKYDNQGKLKTGGGSKGKKLNLNVKVNKVTVKALPKLSTAKLRGIQNAVVKPIKPILRTPSKRIVPSLKSTL
jgi:hypothetical protein